MVQEFSVAVNRLGLSTAQAVGGMTGMRYQSIVSSVRPVAVRAAMAAWAAAASSRGKV